MLFFSNTEIQIQTSIRGKWDNGAHLSEKFFKTNRGNDKDVTYV